MTEKHSGDDRKIETAYIINKLNVWPTIAFITIWAASGLGMFGLDITAWAFGGGGIIVGVVLFGTFPAFFTSEE